MSKTIVLIPTQFEFSIIKEHLLKSKYSFICSGLGIKSLNSIKNIVLNQKINEVIIYGFAGDLKNQFKIGQVLIINKLFLEDSAVPITLETQMHCFESASLATVNKPIYENFLKNKYALIADLIDMESYYVAEFCKLQNIKISIYRCVLDYADNKELENLFKSTDTTQKEHPAIKNFIEAAKLIFL